MAGSVRKRGDTWQYSFETGMVNGKRQRKHKGGFITKRQAETALRIAINEYENGGLQVNENNITLSDMLDIWFKDYVLLNCKPNTIDSYAINIKHIKKALGNYKLKALSPLIIQQWINDSFGTGKAHGSIKLMFTIFKEALNYAVFPCMYLKENYTKYIKLPKNIKKEKIETITVEQFNKILDIIPDKKMKYKSAFMIAFHTGMRLSEVFGLTWENVDFENNSIMITHSILCRKGKITLESPKSKGSLRTIQIGNTLCDYLKVEKTRQERLKIDYQEYYYKDSNNNDFVCCEENGAPVNSGTIQYWVEQIVSKHLDINFNFHMLRHTHATILLENDANIKDISERLGHKNIVTTLQIYSHVTPKMKNKTVEIFENIIKCDKLR
ncbi:MAG: site-specific integrase [Sebaldella sp.]|nr:site-specific integrase [Sebaldella sp.]